LLRHGQVWRGGVTAWTVAHERWLCGQRFDDPALAATYGHYRAVLDARDAQLGALSLASEVSDWRRFATAGQFMGLCGLVPSEYSSGNSTWPGRITKCGNAHLRTQLVESAWAYQHRPQATGDLRRRQAGVSPETIAGPGPGSSDCADGSAACRPARTPSSWWSSRSPASWPGSCGPR
jgi:transposase